MQRQKVTLLILIDLSAAFDTIDHPVLFNVLETKFGISGTALKWHKSYLSGRQQSILINGTRSNPFDLVYGVPQGSCLGPVLFSQYASTIFTVVNKHMQGVHAYADDHQLYLAFDPNSENSQSEALLCMERCLKDIKSWMISNKLKMNDAKTEFIIIGSRQQLEKVKFSSIHIGNVSVKAVDDVRDLGSYLDKTLSMEKHIDVKVGTAYRQLYSLRRIRKYLTREATETLIHSLIFSHIDYCNALLYNLPQTQTKKLQMVQNMAARLVFRLPKFSHVTPLFIKLHWLPVSYRIQFKILLYTFKGIHKLAPAYICEMFQEKSTQYCCRSANLVDQIEFHFGEVAKPIESQDIVCLKVPKVGRVKFEDRSLAIAGPTLWNKLPIKLRCLKDLDMFKSELKTHLFRAAYDL